MWFDKPYMCIYNLHILTQFPIGIHMEAILFSFARLTFLILFYQLKKIFKWILLLKKKTQTFWKECSVILDLMDE